MQELTETERAVLALAGRRFTAPGAQERAARRELGMGATEYFLRLNQLLEDPRAVRSRPDLVRRLRAQRDGQPAEALDPDA